MIEELNKNFIAVEINLTHNKFPTHVPGLMKWSLIFSFIPSLKNGFVTSVILDPTGKTALADAGSSNIWETSKAINYNPDKYLKFLQDAIATHIATP